MAKKRKPVSKGNFRNQLQDYDYDNENDQKKVINTYKDVADSEDEFFINRDRILLEEGPEQKRQRILEEDEAFLEPSDEEILAEPSDASISNDDDDDDDVHEAPYSHGEGKGSRRVMAPDEISELEGSAAPEDDEDAVGWGESRKDYYNADPIETEADALEEEAEARRLQQKQLQGMTEADFGLDEIDWALAGKTTDGEEIPDTRQKNVISEILPRLENLESMGPEERMKILKTRYPEFEPLAKEFVEMQKQYDDIRLGSEAATSLMKNGFQESYNCMPMETVKCHALQAYLAALCMYFALLSSGSPDSNGKPTPLAPTELRDHSIMDTLLQCRSLWEKVRDIKVAEPSSSPPKMNGTHKNGISKATSQDNTPSSSKPPDLSAPRKTKSRSRKSASQRAAESALADSIARRAARVQETEASLADLSAIPSPSSQPTKPSMSRQNNAAANDDDSSDLGDPEPLTAQEAALKADRKRSLRFYTSQIAQKVNRRGAAGREAGGDEDVPYKERLKDREERLMREAEARGKRSSKAVDNDSPTEDDDDAIANKAKKIPPPTNDNDKEENYYDFIARHDSAKKSSSSSSKTPLPPQPSTLPGYQEEFLRDPSGKRKISYAISKNKGLMPNRKKEVRNPRVKKRKKFEEKLK
ncbi:MAG: hypothetical protein Q9190_006073, partial [Brigantiaea leucoxantha]